MEDNKEKLRGVYILERILCIIGGVLMIYLISVHALRIK